MEPDPTGAQTMYFIYEYILNTACFFEGQTGKNKINENLLQNRGKATLIPRREAEL